MNHDCRFNFFQCHTQVFCAIRSIFGGAESSEKVIEETKMVSFIEKGQG